MIRSGQFVGKNGEGVVAYYTANGQEEWKKALTNF
jgi:predicted component of type VI protein secretion system